MVSVKANNNLIPLEKIPFDRKISLLKIYRAPKIGQKRQQNRHDAPPDILYESVMSYM